MRQALRFSGAPISLDPAGRPSEGSSPRWPGIGGGRPSTRSTGRRRPACPQEERRVEPALPGAGAVPGVVVHPARRGAGGPSRPRSSRRRAQPQRRGPQSGSAAFGRVPMLVRRCWWPARRRRSVARVQGGRAHPGRRCRRTRSPCHPTARCRANAVGVDAVDQHVVVPRASRIGRWPARSAGRALARGTLLRTRLRAEAPWPWSGGTLTGTAS